MKKMIKIVSGIVLLTAASSAFATKLTCPSISDIRNKATLERAAELGDKGAWGFTSNAFNFDGANWNIIMFAMMPGIGDPGSAVSYAQYFLDKSVLVQPEVLSTDGTHMTCSYTRDGFKYSVYAETPANFGIYKR